MPGNAKRITLNAETSSGCRRKREPKKRSARIDNVATTNDSVTLRPAAIRSSRRARNLSPLAFARATNVVTPSSSPITPSLLIQSVAPHATEKRPNETGPSKRAMRMVKIARKFEVIIASVLSHAPRFSSRCVSSAPVCARSTIAFGKVFGMSAATIDQIQFHGVMFPIDDARPHKDDERNTTPARRQRRLRVIGVNRGRARANFPELVRRCVVHGNEFRSIPLRMTAGFVEEQHDIVSPILRI